MKNVYFGIGNKHQIVEKNALSFISPYCMTSNYAAICKMVKYMRIQAGKKHLWQLLNCAKKTIPMEIFTYLTFPFFIFPIFFRTKMMGKRNWAKHTQKFTTIYDTNQGSSSSSKKLLLTYIQNMTNHTNWRNIRCVYIKIDINISSHPWKWKEEVKSIGWICHILSF